MLLLKSFCGVSKCECFDLIFFFSKKYCFVVCLEGKEKKRGEEKTKLCIGRDERVCC